MKLVFATQNAHKVEEARGILGADVEILTPAELGLTEDVEETGTTLEENSLLKANFIRERLGVDCFADDSGLEVDILNGAPGVYSARYGGEAHNFEANIRALLKNISLRLMEAGFARQYKTEKVKDTLKARFRTVATLIIGGEVKTFEGVLEGRITFFRAGEGGFGYDPVFVPDEILSPEGALIPNSESLTIAQLGTDVKNQISHRSKALHAMAAYLKTL